MRERPDLRRATHGVADSARVISTVVRAGGAAGETRNIDVADAGGGPMPQHGYGLPYCAVR